jgi:hypothetical protein
VGRRGMDMCCSGRKLEDGRVRLAKINCETVHGIPSEFARGLVGWWS